MRKPGVTYDAEVDALYILLHPEGNIRRTMCLGESVILDLDLDGEVLGIEILEPPPEVTERFSE